VLDPDVLELRHPDPLQPKGHVPVFVEETPEPAEEAQRY
jgi:hypothetical protein